MIRTKTIAATNNLQSAYLNLKLNDVATVRKQICKQCDFSEPTFYRYLKNPDQVPALARPVYAKYLKRSVKFLFASLKVAA